MKNSKLWITLFLICCSLFAFDKEVLYDSIDSYEDFLKFPEAATAVVYSYSNDASDEIFEETKSLITEDVSQQKYSHYPFSYYTVRKEIGITDVVKARSGTSPTSSFVTRVLQYDSNNILEGYSYFLSRMRPGTRIKRDYVLHYEHNALSQIVCTINEKQYKQDSVHEVISYAVAHDTLDNYAQATVSTDSQDIIIKTSWDSVSIGEFNDTTIYTYRCFNNWNDSSNSWISDTLYTITYDEKEGAYIRSIYRDYYRTETGNKIKTVKMFHECDTLRYVQHLYYDQNAELAGFSKYTMVYGGETSLTSKFVAKSNVTQARIEQDALHIAGVGANELLSIVNAQGRLIIRARAGAQGSLRLPVGHLSSGVHFLITEKQRVKFVK